MFSYSVYQKKMSIDYKVMLNVHIAFIRAILRHKFDYIGMKLYSIFLFLYLYSITFP